MSMLARVNSPSLGWGREEYLLRSSPGALQARLSNAFTHTTLMT